MPHYKRRCAPTHAQNYVVDVTDFVQAWVKTPARNYGMLIHMQTEQYYNSMVFNSGQGPKGLQPRLEVTYEIVK